MGNNKQKIVAVNWVKCLKEAIQTYLEHTKLQNIFKTQDITNVTLPNNYHKFSKTVLNSPKQILHHFEIIEIWMHFRII